MAIKINIKDKGKKGVAAKKDNKKNSNLFTNQNNKNSEKPKHEKISVSSYTNDDKKNEANSAALNIESNTKENILNMIKEVKPTNGDEKLPKDNQKNDEVEDSMKKSVGLLKMMGYTDEDIYESFNKN